MPSFGYLVADENGKEKKGSLEAANLEQARNSLKSQGLTILRLGEQSALQKDIQIDLFHRIKPRDYSVFCRQMVSMLNAGVTIIDALGMLAEATENKDLARGIREVQTSIQKGETLSDSMRVQPKVFPAMLVQLVEAGESSGSLENSFARMANQFEKEAKIKSMIKKASIYPIIVCVVALIVVIVMLVWVIPGYTDTFAELGTELPLVTRIVVALSNAFVSYWYLILAAAVLLIAAVKRYAKSDSGKQFFGKLAIKIPLFGKLNVKTYSSLLARTLSTMIAAGIPLVEALGISARTMKNQLFRDAVFQAQEDVAKGLPLSGPLKYCGLFPPMIYHMTRIGEETGEIETMLERLADYYDEEVEVGTQTVMAALEPLIILLLAVIVIILVVAIMAPMITAYNAMDQM